MGSPWSYFVSTESEVYISDYFDRFLSFRHGWSFVNESSCGTAWTGLFFTIVILFLRYSVYTFFCFDRFVSSRYEWSGVNECFGGTD